MFIYIWIYYKDVDNNSLFFQMGQTAQDKQDNKSQQKTMPNIRHWFFVLFVIWLILIIKLIAYELILRVNYDGVIK
jgi:hypothetical protein